MSKFVKALLIVLLGNIALALVFVLPMFMAKGEDGLAWLVLGLVVMGLALLVQLILGIVFVAGQTKKEIGKALLVGTGLLLIIGLSVCGGAAFLG
ncbi:MAG: hypothetical protein JST39_07345 [Bacteroidetes bacterium]|nr:hypothetical protein [Bacteroidota bacterium]